MRTTRLAPSPTGALHLGNARTFLVNWLLARQGGWRIALRVDDLDGPRVKVGADAQAIEDLRWLVLDWDEGPTYQSPRAAVYQSAVDSLLSSGAAYYCVCSRKEVEGAASAPHAEDGAAIYPGTCRGRYRSIEEARAASGREPAVRFAVPTGEVLTFDDAFAGPQSFDVGRRLGDFVIAKADGTAAYHLATVIDDSAMLVSDVVRGDDLLDSTPRQILLYRALGLADRVPRYCHLPLVVGPDGRRLAKRHGDTRLAYYRERGVRAARVLALLARWCGMEPVSRPETASDLLQQFRLDALPRGRIVFTAADDHWLREGAPG
jgi:glutamyl-tRNA synthetase